MIDKTLQSRLPASVHIHRDVELRHYTTFQLGGACPALIDCPDADSLCGSARLLIENGLSFIIIGQGSNLLVSDEGIDSVVLRYCAEENPVEIEGTRVRAGGQTLLDDLARLAIEQGVGDLSFCSGIPGTVGGAIAGNAGAFGRQIGDVLESARIMELDGTIRDMDASDLQFAYRSSLLKQSGAVVLDAVLKLKVEDRDAMRMERERILELRRTKHPDWKINPLSLIHISEPTRRTIPSRMPSSA